MDARDRVPYRGIEAVIQHPLFTQVADEMPDNHEPLSAQCKSSR